MWKILRALDDGLENLVVRVLRSKLMFLGLVLAVGYGLMGPRPSAETPTITDGEIASALEARPWVDRMPEAPDDHFKLYFFTKERFDRKSRVGVYMSGNFWKREIEIFAYKVEEKTVNFFFPYDESRARSSVEVKNRSDQPEFDMTMVLQNDPRSSGKKGVYFSCEEWGESQGDPMQAIQSRLDEWKSRHAVETR